MSLRLAERATPEKRFEAYVEKRTATACETTLPVRVDKTLKAGQVSVERHCNQKCRFCHNDNFAPRMGRSALDNAQFVHLLKVLSGATGLPLKIHIAGNGEPTLTGEELVDLVARMKALESMRRVALTTNGLMLGQMAADLAKAGLDSVNVSIHSMNADSYAFHTGSGKAALERVLASVATASDAGLQVKINCVVTDTLPGEIMQYVRFAEDAGVDIKMFPIIMKGEDARVPMLAMEQMLVSMAQKTVAYAKLHNGRIFLIGKAIIDFVNDAILNLCPQKKCPARVQCEEGCRYHARLSAEGILQPCPVRFNNMVDLLSPNTQVQDILAALRDGGKIA